jgi:hypothetical protein
MLAGERGGVDSLALGMNRRAVVVIRRRLAAMEWSPAE